jgi:hypothetical protein
VWALLLEALTVTVQLPLAGILASARVTVLDVALTDTDAPVHVVAGAGELAIVRPLGSVSLKWLCVSAYALALVNVNVSVEAIVSPTLDGENDCATVGGVGVTVSAVGQAEVPAVVGALLDALPEVAVMLAVFVPPRLSVTVRVTVPDPDTVVVFPTLLLTLAPPLAPHAYEAIVRPQEAALALAFKEPPEIATAAIGSCAACTALYALTMPAPHWPEERQEHWSVEGSSVGQVGRFAVLAGKAAALASRRATSWAGVRLALTDRINAAIPDTMGAEKLVPKFGLESSAFASSLE